MAMASIFHDILILTTAWSHVLLTPYTKVEESFNLHATHDVLMYGLDPESIRNVCAKGVGSRESFTEPLLVRSLCFPWGSSALFPG